jgi:hypothetical protein
MAKFSAESSSLLSLTVNNPLRVKCVRAPSHLICNAEIVQNSVSTTLILFHTMLWHFPANEGINTGDSKLIYQNLHFASKELNLRAPPGMHFFFP